MNIELLKKLTRLANNNPNDNEANLAARRVCKMLEEGQWALHNTPEQPKFKQPAYSYNPFEDLINRYYTQAPGYSTPDYETWYKEDNQRKKAEREHNREKQQQHAWNYGFKNAYSKPPKSSASGWKKEDAPTQKCGSCGKDFKSPYETNRCSACLWRNL